MERKMVILKDYNNKNEICFLLTETLEISKKNSDMVEAFSKLVKINEKLNNKIERYSFSFIENDEEKSVNYFNNILEGKRKNTIEEGTLSKFIYLYIEENFEKYNKLIGLSPLEKAKKIISDYRLKNGLRNF